MIRIRLRTGRTALFGAIFVIALIVFLPMRLMLGWIGLGENGLTAREAKGSLWFGELVDAHAAGFALGDLRAHVSPIRLLVGRAQVDMAAEGAGALDGAISLSRHSIGIDDLTAELAGGAAFAPFPVSSIDLDDLSARFQDGACDHADGRVRATLGGTIEGVPLPQAMAGTARCDGNALLLPLASTAGTESLDLRLRADGGYTADFTMRTADSQTGTRLQLAGFSPSANGYLLSVRGHL